jgi:hypothetical protein
MTMTCRKCGVGLPTRSGPGRPAVYCSRGCQRAAEYELRRAQDAVASVEKNIRVHREWLATQPFYGLGCCGKAEAVTRQLDWLDGERQRLEGRMKVLLDDPEDTVEETSR